MGIETDTQSNSGRGLSSCTGRPYHFSVDLMAIFKITPFKSFKDKSFQVYSCMSDQPETVSIQNVEDLPLAYHMFDSEV